MALREHLSNVRYSENARKKNDFDTENSHAPLRQTKMRLNNEIKENTSAIKIK